MKEILSRLSSKVSKFFLKSKLKNIQVFIGYVIENLEDAKKINKALEDCGLRTWFEYESLLPGDNWKIKLAEAIQESDYFYFQMLRYKKED
ncbi:MAG: toll/interleukin-1 receptor domain-containing protein [Desulfococcaceae bacterium]